MKINKKSDFDFILKLVSCIKHEDGTCEYREVGWPEHDWTAKLRAASGLFTYEVSRKGDTLVNCYNDGGRIHVVCNNHRLGRGRLKCEFHAELPNGIYPDGVQDLYEPQTLDIELVDGPGDCASSAEVELLTPYIKGDRGDKLTYADLTPPDKANLIAPIKEDIDRAITGKQDRLTTTTDFSLTDNLLSLTEQGKVHLFDSLWATIGGTKLADGSYRMGADGKALTLAEAMLRYERNAFIDRWNRDCRMVGYDYYGRITVNEKGKYNEATGCFELHGLTDITFEEAENIMAVPRPGVANINSMWFSGYNIRTNPPIYNSGRMDYIPFFGQYRIEVIDLPDNTTVPNGLCYQCFKLHTIRGVLSLTGSQFAEQCGRLENMTVKLATANVNYKFSGNGILSYDSVKYMIDNTTVACTITFHPNIYAKLTGDTDNAAAAALTEEELAQWMAITTAAAAKNISFVTV